MPTIVLNKGELVLLIYLLAINLAAFFIYGLDKSRAGQINTSRVSEKILWLLALLGGSLGSLAAMKLFRHKTKKLSFQAPLAIILALQILLVWRLLTST